MGFFAKWRIHKAVRAGGQVEVSEKDGIRRMHFGSDTVQSAMRINDPCALEVGYTRSMMAFLLFNPDPHVFLMVGLGGGSTAKWVHQYLPAARTTVVEINPEVVSTARAYFQVPQDEERLRVLIGDGAHYVEAHPHSCDVLMLDGYNEVAQSEALSTPEFYAACRAALKPGGILVVNLWGSDKRYHEYVDRISACFGGVFLCLPAEQRGNVIVFGFERSPNMPKWDDLRERARRLEVQYGMEFVRFAEGFRKLNLHNDKRLLV
ncbi:MAG: polyamine aminopropyltransferase [Burkholderiales bacterium]|nr:polyamine aminopropyltransferase [Burkholderiales bacterium]